MLSLTIFGQIDMSDRDSKQNQILRYVTIDTNKANYREKYILTVR